MLPFSHYTRHFFALRFCTKPMISH